MHFQEKLNKLITKNNSILSIGLDSDQDKIPKHLLSLEDPLFVFNKAIIDATHDLVCAYKPNIAFYEAYGEKGHKNLKKTTEYLQAKYPEIPIILDAKRGDIGSTAKMYAKTVFDYWMADAVTVNPYLGLDSLEPFLKYEDKGIIILCRTSNPNASDFQDLMINNIPLYIYVAKKAVEWNKKYNNCILVVGSTWPEQLKKIRKIAPEMFFLVPGIGTQGGDLKKTLEYGLTKTRSGLIINSSSAIIYASSEKDFAQKARETAMTLKNQINKGRGL